MKAELYLNPGNEHLQLHAENRHEADHLHAWHGQTLTARYDYDYKHYKAVPTLILRKDIK